jgi:hypothetical protein
VIQTWSWFAVRVDVGAAVFKTGFFWRSRDRDRPRCLQRCVPPKRRTKNKLVHSSSLTLISHGLRTARRHPQFASHIQRPHVSPNLIKSAHSLTHSLTHFSFQPCFAARKALLKSVSSSGLSTMRQATISPSPLLRLSHTSSGKPSSRSSPTSSLVTEAPLPLLHKSQQLRQRAPPQSSLLRSPLPRVQHPSRATVAPPSSPAPMQLPTFV